MDLETFYRKMFFEKNTLINDFYVKGLLVSIKYDKKRDSFLFSTKVFSEGEKLSENTEKAVLKSVNKEKKSNEPFLKILSGSLTMVQKVSLFSSVPLKTFLNDFSKKAKNWKGFFDAVVKEEFLVS
jgi:hypothetical protein